MKKLLLIAGAALMASASHAAYLYWQVDDSVLLGYNETAPSGYEVGPGAYAVLKDSNGNSYQSATYGADGLVTDGKASINQSYYSELSGDDPSAYSYFVEIYNSDNYVIARSAVVNSESGSDWTSAYADSLRTSELSQIPNVTVWHSGSFSAVPEPTSGLMVLLGAAMLGLKRKRRSLA